MSPEDLENMSEEEGQKVGQCFEKFAKNEEGCQECYEKEKEDSSSSSSDSNDSYEKHFRDCKDDENCDTILENEFCNVYYNGDNDCEEIIKEVSFDHDTA